MRPKGGDSTRKFQQSFFNQKTQKIRREQEYRKAEKNRTDFNAKLAAPTPPNNKDADTLALNVAALMLTCHAAGICPK